MTVLPEEGPRTLREVGIYLGMMRKDIDNINARLDGIRNWVIGGLACPIIVGVVLTIIFKN